MGHFPCIFIFVGAGSVSVEVLQLVLGTNPPTHPACMSCQCHALLHGSFSQNCVVPALSTFLASSVLLLLL